MQEDPTTTGADMTQRVIYGGGAANVARIGVLSGGDESRGR
jgi:hypothetical protein